MTVRRVNMVRVKKFGQRFVRNFAPTSSEQGANYLLIEDLYAIVANAAVRGFGWAHDIASVAATVSVDMCIRTVAARS